MTEESAPLTALPSWVDQANHRGLLAVHEVYLSLQGETSLIGFPCVLVRLTGCPLRCSWCDTAHAYEEGDARSIDDVVAEAGSLDCGLVALTGGEPLAQAPARALVTSLADAGATVQVETSGAVDVGGLDPRARLVLDLKPPASGMTGHMRWSNLALLRSGDEVKFVVADRADYEWARDLIDKEGLVERCGVLVSPAWPTLHPAEVAGWVLEDRLPVRFQVPLQRTLWGSDTRGR